MKHVLTSTKTILNLGEYCVKAYDQNGNRMPACDYFTDDKADAQMTAQAMVGMTRTDTEAFDTDDDDQGSYCPHSATGLCASCERAFLTT